LNINRKFVAGAVIALALLTGPVVSAGDTFIQTATGPNGSSSDDLLVYDTSGSLHTSNGSLDAGRF
jgi:hypothetical protein